MQNILPQVILKLCECIFPLTEGFTGTQVLSGPIRKLYDFTWTTFTFWVISSNLWWEHKDIINVWYLMILA